MPRHEIAGDVLDRAKERRKIEERRKNAAQIKTNNDYKNALRREKEKEIKRLKKKVIMRRREQWRNSLGI